MNHTRLRCIKHGTEADNGFWLLEGVELADIWLRREDILRRVEQIGPISSIVTTTENIGGIELKIDQSTLWFFKMHKDCRVALHRGRRYFRIDKNLTLPEIRIAR